MQLPFQNLSLPLLQQQLAEEEKNYQEALKKDLPFFKLKEIKSKINHLKTELHNTEGKHNNCN